MTTALGTTELVLALKDEDELIEKLPNGYLDATIDLTVEYIVDNKKVEEIVHGALSISEGVMTLKIPAETSAQIASDVITIKDIVIEGVNERELFKSNK